ncbi:MAG TPA: hypothetical protein VEN99_06410 [Acidimicrobiia bacterium]|nr:hypothetical protein [Acidimicrobiia bacterium]
MRGRIVAGAFGLGCAGLLVLTMVTPAAGERRAPDRGCGGCGMPAGGVADDCEDASMNTPPGGGAGVKLTADVTDGATVAPGEDILLRLTWDRAKWSGDQVDRALDCVRVKGDLAPDLSAEEQPADNDGVYEYRLHVPDDIRPGCDICAQGFVSGESAGGGPQQVRSERHCFMSGPAGPPTPPATRPPATPATPASQPPPTTAAAPPARAPSEVPTQVGGITASQPGAVPGAQVAPAPAAAEELPRTGAASSRAATTGGGLALALGGFAVMGGAGRRRRRSTRV